MSKTKDNVLVAVGLAVLFCHELIVDAVADVLLNLLLWMGLI